MKEKEEIKEILEALADCDFTEFRSYTFRNEVVSDFRDSYKKPFNWDEGATKGVLIFDTLGFVIKLPYRGDYYDPDEGLEEFCGANTQNGWDYCEAEEYYGNKADEYGVGNCFAKTISLGTVNGHPVYYQEIVESFSSVGSSSHSREEIDEMEDKVSSFYNNDIDLDWLCDAYDYHGEEIFYQFMGFIENFSINDLHNGNIGYIGMKPVVLDYSCWHD